MRHVSTINHAYFSSEQAKRHGYIEMYNMREELVKVTLRSTRYREPKEDEVYVGMVYAEVIKWSDDFVYYDYPDYGD